MCVCVCVCLCVCVWGFVFVFGHAVSVLVWVCVAQGIYAGDRSPRTRVFAPELEPVLGRVGSSRGPRTTAPGEGLVGRTGTHGCGGCQVRCVGVWRALAARFASLAGVAGHAVPSCVGRGVWPLLLPAAVLAPAPPYPLLAPWHADLTPSAMGDGTGHE